MRDLIDGKVKATDGRISAKRLLLIAQAAGYTDSARNFRRAVAARKRGASTAAGVPAVDADTGRAPGHRLGDRGRLAGVLLGAGLEPLAVRAGRDQKAAATTRLLADCFEKLSGTPKVALADRMGCLKGGSSRTPSSRPLTTCGSRRTSGSDFCEAADPESKGMIEALCRYAQDDLIVPADAWSGEAEANDACRA